MPALNGYPTKNRETTTVDDGEEQAQLEADRASLWSVRSASR
jgi:hypothetical protein